MAQVIAINRKPLVKAEVVAEYLSCCEVTVLRLARTGKIPAVSIRNGARKLWRFDLDAVVRSMENHEASA